MHTESGGNVLEKENTSPEIPVYTIDEVINMLGYGGFQVYLFVFCGIWYLVEACELMILSLLMPTLREKWELSTLGETLLGSVVLFGVVFGSSIFGFISDSYGRRKAIYVSVFCTITFGTISAFCDNYYLFLCLRFLVGVCVGSVTVPYSLLLEFLPNRRRGLGLVLLSMCWSIGSIYESVLGWVVLPNLGNHAWQFYVGFSLLPLIFSLPLLICLPESIRYLTLKHGDRNNQRYEEQIKRTIGRIEKMNCRQLPHRQYTIEFIPPNTHEKNFFLELLRDRGLLFMFVNMCIFNIGAGFLYYSFMLIVPDLFTDRMTGNMMYFGTFLNSCMELLCVIVLFILIPIFPRKIVQFICYVFAGISLLILAIPVDLPKPLFMITTFIARIFIAGGGTCSNILSQESLPTNVRGRGFGFAYSLSKFVSSFAPFLAKMVVDNHISMAIMFIVSVITGFSTIIHPKETKMESLVEIFGSRGNNNNNNDIIKRKKNEELKKMKNDDVDEASVPLLSKENIDYCLFEGSMDTTDESEEEKDVVD